jgi:methyl-accepting chemotaxis protein
MNLNVMQKIMLGYIVGFLLLSAFATLTLFNGKQIESTTLDLSQTKIPALITAANLKSDLQVQINQLYELYATNDHKVFEENHQKSMDMMNANFAKLRSLEEYKFHEPKLLEIGVKQDNLAKIFVDVMKQPEVDWDKARDALAAFSASANAMSQELDTLVKQVADRTLLSAQNSQHLTEQLIQVGILLAVLVFLGVITMAYYAHSQVAKPLKAVSSQLTDLTNRHDLTYRLKHFGNDEVGDIVNSTNHLLEEFQKLTHTLYGTSEEMTSTLKGLTDISEMNSSNSSDRENKLKRAVINFMDDIKFSPKTNDVLEGVDIELHRTQLKFIQSHLKDIDEDTQATLRNTEVLRKSTLKLQKLADNMHNQIRSFNF